MPYATARRSLLSDFFDHHVWATARLLEACDGLDIAQLDTVVPGTYGSILETLCHIVAADATYLSLLTDGRVPPIDDDDMDLSELRSTNERHGAAWSDFVTEELDPNQIVARGLDDGTVEQGTLGFRLAQAIYHGTDHRSQICIALSSLDIAPPDIDAWAWAEEAGRLGWAAAGEVPTTQ